MTLFFIYRRCVADVAWLSVSALCRQYTGRAWL